VGNFLDAGNNVMRQKVGKNPSAVGATLVARPTNNTADSRAATQGRPYFFHSFS